MNFKQDGVPGSDSFRPAYGEVTVCCVHGDKRTIKWGDFWTSWWTIGFQGEVSSVEFLCGL